MFRLVPYWFEPSLFCAGYRYLVHLRVLNEVVLVSARSELTLPQSPRFVLVSLSVSLEIYPRFPGSPRLWRANPLRTDLGFSSRQLPEFAFAVSGPTML